MEYKFDELSDLDGDFRGHIGRGELYIRYESGATITGKVGFGDFFIQGKTTIVHK